MPLPSRNGVTVERLKEVLNYDPETGEFRWKVAITNRKAGSIAGRNVGNGYRYIRIDNVEYTASRLAWVYVYGTWPKRLAFLNGDGMDVRIANLCEVEHKPSKHNWRTKEGRAAYQKEYRQPRRQFFRDDARRRMFGITPEWYQHKLSEQAGLCAICKQPETRYRMGVLTQLTVDHNHTSGAVRELLCNSCNVLIGHAREDVGILRAAIAYLERHNGHV